MRKQSETFFYLCSIVRVDQKEIIHVLVSSSLLCLNVQDNCSEVTLFAFKEHSFPGSKTNFQTCHKYYANKLLSLVKMHVGTYLKRIKQVWLSTSVAIKADV